MVLVDSVRELQQRPEVTADAPAAFVVRVGEPQVVTPEEMRDDPAVAWRTHVGWHIEWPWETQADGVRGDWAIDDQACREAGRLVVLVGGFVADAYAIKDLDTQYIDGNSGRRRSRFLVEADEEAAAPFVGRRWTLGRGWTTAVVGGRT
jgi:hypothetical protein